jgi:hypothetical protein
VRRDDGPIKLGGIHAVAALLPTIPHFLLNVMILHYHPGKGPPSPGAWPSSYSGFGSAAGAASAGTAVTAGASSAGGASTAGSAGFTTSTAGSSGVVIAITVSSGIAITPREVGENRRGHLP